MRIVNLCPHEIDLRLPDGTQIVIPPSERPARVRVMRYEPEELKLERTGEAPVAIPVSSSCFGDVDDLPAPASGTCFVVSYPVAYACAQRDDLLVPDDLIRDDHGTVVACQSLTRITTLAP